MKTFLFGLTLACSLPALAQAPTPVENPTPAEAPFEAKIHLQTGQRFRTSLDMNIKVSETIPAIGKGAAMRIDTVGHTRMEMDQNVLSSDASGSKIEMVYHDVMQQNRMMQNGKVMFDSAKPGKGMEFMSDYGKNIVGAKLGYRLSPTGKITDITGTQAYFERILASAGKNQTPQQRETMKAFLKGFMSPDALKSTLEKSFGSQPTKPIAIGESWTYSITLPLGAALSPTVVGKRTFLGRKSGLAIIDEKSTFTTNANQKIVLPVPAKGKAAPPTMYFAMNGTVTGQTLVDETTGLVSQSNATQRLGGKITLIMMGAKASRSSFPLYGLVEMKSTMTDISAVPSAVK